MSEIMNKTKIFLVIGLCVVVFKCQENTHNEEEIQKIRTDSLKYGRVVEDAILNFKLRETENSVFQKLKELAIESKITSKERWKSAPFYKWMIGFFYYTFNTSSGPLKGRLDFYFTSSERYLYEINIFIVDKENQSGLNEIYALYKNKYVGKEYMNDGKKQFISIDGKREINVEIGEGYGFIEYLDLELKHLNSLNKPEKNDESIKKTEKDI